MKKEEKRKVNLIRLYIYIYMVKLPYKWLDRPVELLKLEADRNFRQSTYEDSKVFSPTHRPPLLPPPPPDIPGIHFCSRLIGPHRHGVAGRIKTTKNSSDPAGNQTRDIPACSAEIYIYMYKKQT